MWKWKNKKSTQKEATDSDTKRRYEQVATIPINTKLKGDLLTNDNLRIDGKIDGKIHSQSHVVIGNDAVIVGNIKCRTLIVMGKVIGNCLALEYVHLTNTAIVEGNILTKQIEIDKESKLSGTYKLLDKEIAL